VCEERNKKNEEIMMREKKMKKKRHIKGYKEDRRRNYSK
jgi:hypothetical protein